MSNFANPTGASLPAAVRRAVRTACTDRDVWLLEDDAYHELALDGPAGTPACAYPGGLGAVYTSTFSKSIAPGLRVGYLYSPDHELVRRIGQLKQVTDLHASTLAQRMVEEYLDDPGSEADIAAIRNAYRSRRDAMLEALDKELGAMERAGRVRWTRPGGGMFIFVDLPEEVGGEQLLDACWDQGLAFVPGDTFFADTGTGPARKNTIRLNFVSEGEDRIREGVAILARVLKGMAEANGTA
ncbi:pyridoxal phosphate-dependent transferase [Hyaloraphidium curvatum]|nr:pyridoxal phosphate-dependent transferase [Hyaloraphidium curvatum]